MKIINAILALFLLAGCGGAKISKPILKMIVAGSNRISTAPAYADSCGFPVN